MARFSERSYSPSNAFKNMGSGFWAKYRDDLLIYAKDRTRVDIPEKIHSEWDGFLHRRGGIDIRIDWAIALYDHGDWPDLQQDVEEGTASSGAIEETSEVKTERPAVPSERDIQTRHRTEETQHGGQDVNKPSNSSDERQTIKRKCSNCRFSKNPERCGHGMLGPCDDWVEATKVEEWWPTWEDMKRAEYEDYRSRYKEL